MSCASTGGLYAQKTLNLSGFDGVVVLMAAEVKLVQSSDFKVEVDGPQTLVDELAIDVNDSTLRIKKKDDAPHKHFMHQGIVRVKVCAPHFQYVGMKGSGTIVAKSALTSDSMKIELTGSGDMSFDNLRANTAFVKLKGSGDVSLTGPKPAKLLTVELTGSGDVCAKHFPCDEAHIKLLGSGDVRVKVLKQLESKSTGSGDIYVYGKPSTVSVSQSGSGEVIFQ